MSAPLKIELVKNAPVRAAYEGVAYDTLRTLWRRKLSIGTLSVTALLLASIVLVLVGPRYTGEALIQLNFDRDEPATATNIQPVAPMDPVAIVDSAASLIRSRATASAVVARLGLDKDPAFAHESALWRIVSDVRTALGLVGAKASPRDLAVNSLMRVVTVTNQPHSYLISIATTARDPEQAATLANAVALEYLRGEARKQLAHRQAAVMRELAQLSSIYGVSHPGYAAKRVMLENLNAAIDILRDGSPADDTYEQVIGQSFIAAEKVTAPSGPIIMLILGLAVGAAFALGTWLALLVGRPIRPEAVGAVPTRNGSQALRKK
jgi:uncharacterized protein involved in exopolysaccharide biosynthesis